MNDIRRIKGKLTTLHERLVMLKAAIDHGDTDDIKFQYDRVLSVMKKIEAEVDLADLSGAALWESEPRE